MKAQVSIEYIMVLVTLLVIAVPAAYIFNSYSDSSTDQISYSQIETFGRTIVTTASRVYYLGEPSRMMIEGRLPDNVVSINFSTIWNKNMNELVFTTKSNAGKLSELAYSSKVNFNGTFYPRNFAGGVKNIMFEAYKKKDGTVFVFVNFDGRCPESSAYDVNGDCLIDLADSKIIDDCYNQNRTSGTWNDLWNTCMKADYDGDCIVMPEDKTIWQSHINDNPCPNMFAPTCGDGNCDLGENCGTCLDCICDIWNFCQFNSCRACGSTLDVCCPGNICLPGNICSAGFCIPCGDVGQQCCSGNTCTAPQDSCVAGICQAPAVFCPDNTCNGNENCITCSADCACGAGEMCINNDPSLVGYWSFDDGTAKDWASVPHDGTILGNTVSVAGKVGNAMQFDGSTSYINIPNSGAILGTGSITIEAWIKPLAVQERCTNGPPPYNIGIFSKGVDAEWSWQVRFGLAGSACYLGFQVNDEANGVKEVTVGQPLQVGSWYHVASVFDQSAQKIIFYLDGTKVGEIPGVASINENGDTILIGDDGWADRFEGVIDEVKIFSRALSQPEIQAELTKLPKSNICVAPPGSCGDGSCTGDENCITCPADCSCSGGKICIKTDPSLVGYWSFGDGTAKDYSSNNFASQIVGSGVTPDNNGKVGNAMKFDGASYINVQGSGGSLGTQPFTVEAWVKPSVGIAQERCDQSLPPATSPPSYNRGIISKADSAVGWSWQVRYGGSANCYLGLQPNAPGVPWVNIDQPLLQGTWSHVAFVYDGTKTISYLNGNKISETPGVASVAPSGANIRFGDDGWGNSFSGSIDEVKIFSRALSQPEIAAEVNEAPNSNTCVATCGTAGQACCSPGDTCNAGNVCSSKDPSMAGYWNFNNGDATDSSGNGNTGTLHGGVASVDNTLLGGKAMSFNGVNGYISLPSTTLLPSGSWTVEGWVNGADINTRKFWFSQGSTYFELNDRDYFVAWATPQNLYSEPTTINYNTNTWYHVADVYDKASGNLYLYVNGVLEDTQSGSPGDVSAGTDAIGRFVVSPYFYFKGMIDEVKIFSRALPGSEISNEYNNHGAAKCVACGAIGQLCCSGNSCPISGSCTAGMCVANSAELLLQKLSVVTRFEANGDVILKGSLQGWSGPTSDDEFIFRDSLGQDVAIINLVTGNLQLKGALLDNRGVLSPSPLSSDFIVENLNGEVIAYIDESGNFYVKGVFTQNGNP